MVATRAQVDVAPRWRPRGSFL